MTIDRYTVMPPHLPCMDRWPTPLLTDAKKAVYTAAERLGIIRVVNASRLRSETLISYLSICPREWTRDAMRAMAAENAQQTTLGVRLYDR